MVNAAGGETAMVATAAPTRPSVSEPETGTGAWAVAWITACSTRTDTVADAATAQNAPLTKSALRPRAARGPRRSWTTTGANSDHLVTSQSPGSTSRPVTARGSVTPTTDATTSG